MDTKFKKLSLLIVTSILLISTNLKAQIEDILVGTTTRKMLVYAPSGIESNRPLLLSLHGMNQDIAYQQNQSKWETVAKDNNFVLVYPGGINNSWDISGTRDTDFILAIIEEMVKRFDIDRDRVYLSGFSMGGMMTYHAATKIADKIAAFAPVSGYLMGGPNTNSSRPIPIIHTHGTTDDVVPFSGVQTCLNAWIERNNCPDTAQITKPYPEQFPSSTGTKYYWGPGIDSVEIVLLSITGSGHWHSNNENGIHTSREIWDFCKKFSLGFGVPKFVSASVIDNNPKQIQVTFSLPIKDTIAFEGFTIKIDGQAAAIDNIVLNGTNQMQINLSNSILNSNELLLSYRNGNVLSVYEKDLVVFNDTLVENLLYGSQARLIEVKTTLNGDTLLAQFNKKMHIPTDISGLSLSAQYDGDMNIPIIQSSFLNNDSTILVFALQEKIYADYNLLFSYSGSTIASIDSGLLKTFTKYQVTNKSLGLPVNVESGMLEENAYIVALQFSKSMALTDEQLDQFNIEVNGENISIKEYFVLNNKIRFVLSVNLHYGDTIKMSYNPGNITAADKGALVAFSNLWVENPLSIPNYVTIPGKIEAENFYLQYGTDTEPVTDDGGGLNVGWTETGDWLEYVIENNSDLTELEISFRVAAQSAGTRFDYYIDNEKVGQLIIPSTGGWQIWTSAVQDISIDKGKHYFKIVVVTGGFNINYFDIQEEFVSINDINIDNITIFPNPASSKIVIKSAGFLYNKVAIIDMAGKTVMSKSTPYEPELQIPVSLSNGVYSVKISNATDSIVKNIVIKNE